jgi:hypothetical protein
MTHTQLPLGLAQPHNNQRLFADHYLNMTLPQRPPWKLLAHDASAALAQIAPIVMAFVAAPKNAEAQVIVLYRLLFILCAAARDLLRRLVADEGQRRGTAARDTVCASGVSGKKGEPRGADNPTERR